MTKFGIASTTTIIRKSIKMTAMEDILNELYDRAKTLKIEVDVREEDLKDEFVLLEKQKSIKKLIYKKLEFDVSRAFLRNNSWSKRKKNHYFHNYEDSDNIRAEIRRTRYSL